MVTDVTVPLSAIKQLCGTLPRFRDTAGKGQALRERRAQVDVGEFGMELVDALCLRREPLAVARPCWMR
jgi:hypothetical protein